MILLVEDTNDCQETRLQQLFEIETSVIGN